MISGLLTEDPGATCVPVMFFKEIDLKGFFSPLLENQPRCNNVSFSVLIQVVSMQQLSLLCLPFHTELVRLVKY